MFQSSEWLTPQDAADVLFYEAESPGGFLNKLRSQRTFDDQHWQRLWSAVASLTHHNRGELDTWSAYDLAQIVVTVQALGQMLSGRTIDSLDTFESEILEANLFLNDLFSR